MKKSMSKIFVIVGGKKSGKDEVIRGVCDLGGLHAQIVPKYTSRGRETGDGKEIRCNYVFEERNDGDGCDVISQEDDKRTHCDITYYKNQNYYGIDTKQIWEGLRSQHFQILVASETEAINSLKRKFGSLVVLIYIHAAEEDSDTMEFKMFIDNFDLFDHVLIYEKRKEDVYDQLFRLFRAYE